MNDIENLVRQFAQFSPLVQVTLILGSIGLLVVIAYNPLAGGAITAFLVGLKVLHSGSQQRPHNRRRITPPRKTDATAASKPIPDAEPTQDQ